MDSLHLHWSKPPAIICKVHSEFSHESDIAENTVLSMEALFPGSSCSVFLKDKGSIPGISKSMSYLPFYILSLIISASCFLILDQICVKLCLVMRNLFLFTVRHGKVP